MFSKTYTLIIILYIGTLTRYRKDNIPATFRFGIRGKSHDLRRTFPEMHRHKDTGLYPVDELLGTSHKIGPQAGIYRKHDNIHRLRIFRYYIQFFQVIPFRLRNFLWSRLIFPMPIIQVSGMKNQFTLRLDQKRDTDIGRSERPNR